MNNEMTNERLTNASNVVNKEMLKVAETAMCNAYDNVIDMLSKKLNMYQNILADHANVLKTSYGDGFTRILNKKMSVWSRYNMILEIYGKVCEMRYNTSLKVK